MWDPVIQQLVSPPIDEQVQLRGEKLATLGHTTVASGQTVTLGPIPSGRGNQSETLVVFQMPSMSATTAATATTTTFGVVVMGGADGGKATGLYIYVNYSSPATGAVDGDVYMVGVGGVDRGKGHADVMRQPAESSSSAAQEQLGNCSKPQPGVCLAKSFPILLQIHNTVDVGACCEVCLKNPKCISWNMNTKTRICYSRGSYVPNNGSSCIAGQIRPVPPGPPPSPSPPPSPPHPPPPPSRHATARLPLVVGETNITMRVFVDRTFAEVYWQVNTHTHTFARTFAHSHIHTCSALLRWPYIHVIPWFCVQHCTMCARQNCMHIAFVCIFFFHFFFFTP